MHFFHIVAGFVGLLPFQHDENGVADSKIEPHHGQAVSMSHGDIGDLRGVTFASDCSALGFVSSKGSVRVYDLRAGKSIFAIELPDPRIERNAICFLGSAQNLVAGGNDRILRAWRVDDPAVRWKSEERLSSRVYSLTTGPNDLLVSGHVDSIVRVWNSSSGKLTKSLDVGVGPVLSLSFSSSTQRLAVACGNGFQMWNTQSWSVERTIPAHKENVRGIALSPDGRYIGTASFDNTLAIWDAASGREECRLTGSFSALTFSRDGNYIIAGTSAGQLLLIEVASGQVALEHTEAQQSVLCIAAAARGEYIAAGMMAGKLLLWSLRPDKGLTRAAGALIPQCASDDARHAYQAMYELACRGDAGVDAIKLAFERADTSEVSGLLRDLGGNDLEMRSKAVDLLELLGPDAQPALRDALTYVDDLDTRARIRELLARQGDRALLASRPARLRMRGLVTLFMIGSDDALGLLATIAETSPSARERYEAQRLLELSRRDSRGSRKRE